MLGTSGCPIDVDTDADTDPGATDGADGADDTDGADETAGEAGGNPACSASHQLTGSVDGVSAAYDGYLVDTTFYNTSLEEIVLSEIDFEIMEQLGLEPEDPEDQERFKYFSSGFELRNLYMEQLDESYGGFLPKTGRDLSVAFFDLSTHQVQPGTPVEVFDVSPFEAIRNSGDRDAIATMLREMVDQMRSNGQPDAVITFAPDRSDESIVEVVFISMLSPNARFASSGTATFHSVLDASGQPLDALEYPNHDIDALSIEFEAEIDGGPVTLEASCLPTLISG
ncbi:MAG: hypothetical protein KDK70_31655 [Myxococcales bacterium]|nr:hypothetical protein [Myxococcales bacterium]